MNNTPLSRACREGHETIVRHLIKHGASINKENLLDKTSILIN